MKNIHKINENIYITSDEKPKSGDWSLYAGCKLHKCIEDIIGDEFKKIILTTDQDLIKDGVQAIDDEFLEWFVKNPSCEEVEVEKVFGKKWKDYEYYKEWHKDTVPDWAWDYRIIIPKEEPKQESPEEPTMIDDWLNEYGDPEIYKKVERELELREAAEKYSLELLEAKTIQHHEKTWIKSMFIHIAKGQAERMYSEEEVLNIQEKYNEYIQKNFNPEFSILPFKVFFEQFKKK